MSSSQIAAQKLHTKEIIREREIKRKDMERQVKVAMKKNRMTREERRQFLAEEKEIDMELKKEAAAFKSKSESMALKSMKIKEELDIVKDEYDNVKHEYANQIGRFSTTLIIKQGPNGTTLIGDGHDIEMRKVNDGYVSRYAIMDILMVMLDYNEEQVLSVWTTLCIWSLDTFFLQLRGYQFPIGGEGVQHILTGMESFKMITFLPQHLRVEVTLRWARFAQRLFSSHDPVHTMMEEKNLCHVYDNEVFHHATDSLSDNTHHNHDTVVHGKNGLKMDVCCAIESQCRFALRNPA
jgi:hypothetical protein